MTTKTQWPDATSCQVSGAQVRGNGSAISERAAAAAAAVRSACLPGERFVLIILDPKTGLAQSKHNLASQHEAAELVAGMYEVAFRHAGCGNSSPDNLEP